MTSAKRIFILVISVIFLAAPKIIAQSPENLLPNDTVVADFNWTRIGFGNLVDVVTDANDASYIKAIAPGEVARYGFENNSVPADATFDSIGVNWRGQDNGSGNNRQRVRLRMLGNTNYCDGANTSVTASFVDYTDVFTLAPSAPGTCGNSWDSDRFDSVHVQLTVTALGASREIDVSELSIDLYYTEVGGDAIGRRRRIGLIGKFDIDKQEEFAITGKSSFGIALRGASWVWGN